MRFYPLGGKAIGDQLKTRLYANLDAPECLASSAACAGVGTSANRNVVYRIAARSLPGGHNIA